MTRTQIKWEKCGYIALHVLTIIYGFLCFYLYYMQSIQPLDYNNRYFQSDLPYHISMIIDDGWYYSFTAYVYQFLYFICANSTIGIALFLAVVSLATVYATEYAICYFCNLKKSTWYSLFCALICNFIMPFFWEYAGLYRYASYQSPTIWHNSTYQCMKLFALAAFIYFWKLEEKYREQGITLAEWLKFAVLLCVCTGIKPSFLTVWAPIMAGMLLVDLFKKVPFSKIFLFGSAVVPALIVILWQQSVLFGSETGNGICIKPWYAFSLHADRPKVAVLCSLAFALVVLLGAFSTMWKDKKYLFIWAMTGLGFLEALLFVEVGNRAKDGNFLWGYSFALFVLAIYSVVQMVYWIRNFKTIGWKKGICILSGIVLSYQVYCGILFFVRLLQGETYWMLR